MSVVTPTILSEGAKIGAIYELISIDIRREVNRIPYASLVLLDGDAAQRSFDLSDAKYFEPGKEVEVKLRYESETRDTTVFKGVVVRHGVEASGRGSLLRVEIKDKAVKLTQARNSEVFVDKGDAEVMEGLAKAASLKVGKVEAPKDKSPQVVQYYCTDWDFMVLRAESLGLLVVAEDGVVSVRRPNLATAPSLQLDYGISEIYDFELEVDAGSQFDAVESSGWDIKQAKRTQGARAKPFALKQGNLDGRQLAKKVGFGPLQLSHPAPVEQKELQAWADGRLMRSRMSLIRGRVSTRGVAAITLMDTVQIKGVGKRFDGSALVTGVCHRVDADGWVTDLQLGLSAREFAREEAIRDVPAAGLLPGISGLHVGIVDAFEDDPDKQLRVKVRLPGLGEKAASVWARLSAPDAGKERGWFFRPEPEDEVVVGFFNGDPRQPVILGSMFGPTNIPPSDYAETSEENKTKALVTKTGTVIGFVDGDKGSVFIETKDGRKFVLDDDQELIKLSDEAGNELTMDDQGVTMKVAGDFKVEASGKVEIKGASVDMK